MTHRPTPEAIHLLIQGRVQGVGFRYFTQDAAQTFGILGWVRNTSDGHVEAFGQGAASDLDAWVSCLRQGPPLSRVDKVVVNAASSQDAVSAFEIR